MSFTTKEQLIRKEKEVVNLQDQLRKLKQELENERAYSDKLANEIRVKNEVISRNGLESEARKLRKERRKEEERKKKKKESEAPPTNSPTATTPTPEPSVRHSIDSFPKRQTPTKPNSGQASNPQKKTPNKEPRTKKRENLKSTDKEPTLIPSNTNSRPSTNNTANTQQEISTVQNTDENRLKTPQSNHEDVCKDPVENLVNERIHEDASSKIISRSETRETNLNTEASHSSLSHYQENINDNRTEKFDETVSQDNSDDETSQYSNDSDDSLEMMMRERERSIETSSSSRSNDFSKANPLTDSNNKVAKKTVKKENQEIIMKGGKQEIRSTHQNNQASRREEQFPTTNDKYPNAPHIFESKVYEDSPRKQTNTFRKIADNVIGYNKSPRSPKYNLVSSFVQTDETMFAPSKSTSFDDIEDKHIEPSPLRKLDQAEQLRAKLKPRNQRMLELFNKLREKRGEKIKPLPWLLKFMYAIYKSKLVACVSDEDKKMITVPEFIFEHLKQIYGTNKLVDEYALQLLMSVKKFGRTDRRVELFSRFINEDWNVNIVNFYLKVWKGLEDSKVGPEFGQGKAGDDGALPHYVSRIRCMNVLNTLRSEINPILASIVKEMDPKCVTTTDEEYYRALLYAGYRGATELNPMEVWGVPLLLAKQKILKVDFFFIVCECIANYMLSTGTVELPKSDVLPQL